MFQSAIKGSIGVHTNIQQLNITIYSIIDFDVSTSELNTIFGTTDTLFNFYVYQLLGPLYSLGFQIKFTSTLIPANVFISSGKIWTLTVAVGLTSMVQIYDETTGMPINGTSISIDYTKMRVNSAYTIAAIWSDSSAVILMNMTDLTIFTTLIPSNSPLFPVTETITFSQDSLLAIIETDHLNPIIVVDLTNFQTIHNISVNQKIN